MLNAIGPASYVVNTSDLKVVHAGNVLCKYADDTYIIIPSCNVDTRMVELDNVERWAKGNNLTLNRAKCAEMVIHDSRRKSISTTLYRCYFAFCQSSLNEYEWMNEYNNLILRMQ